MASKEDLKRLIEALKDAKDSIVRAKAVKALGDRNDLSVVEPLIQALKDEHWDVRRRAAWVLGNMGEPAVEPLLQALKDEHWDVRRKAAWALGNISDARAIGPLIQALRDEYPDVREEAAWALGNIGNIQAIEPLLHALRDEYPDVRRQAARSLAVLTVSSEEIAKSMIHDYESNLEEQDRDSFRKSKKLYEQELKKLQD
ncbi:MAG: HEAT repeat domain-containing protein [Methanophagales archaeon]|nr:HEAT repeat domain-containing protein [Methanophagales archaeon]